MTPSRRSSKSRTDIAFAGRPHPKTTATRLRLASCRVRDIDAVLALWKRAEAKGSLTDHPADLRRRLARDRRLFILAWDGRRLVGSVIGGWDGWRGNLYRLAVLPDYRRRGIAKMLVAAAESRLRMLGARRVTALVLNRNAKAGKFWLAAGYDRDSTIGRYVRNLDPGAGSSCATAEP